MSSGDPSIVDDGNRNDIPHQDWDQHQQHQQQQQQQQQQRDEMLDFGASVSAARSDTVEPTSTTSTLSTLSSSTTADVNSTSNSPDATAYHPPPRPTSYRDPPQFSPSIAASATRLRRLSSFGDGADPTSTPTSTSTSASTSISTSTKAKNSSRPMSFPHTVSTPSLHGGNRKESGVNNNNTMRQSATITAQQVVNLRRGQTFMTGGRGSVTVKQGVPGQGQGQQTFHTPPPVPRLRRGSTFYTSSSSPPSALRMNNSPANTTSITSTNSMKTTTTTDPSPPSGQLRPRLRRGSTGIQGIRPETLPTNNSFYARPSPGGGGGATFVHRRAADNDSDIGSGSGATDLPRAETIAYGAAGGGGGERSAEDVGIGLRRFDSSLGAELIVQAGNVTDESDAEGDEQRGDRICGMCSGCKQGLKGFPPWAPERLKEMSEDERRTVLAEMEAMEQKGKLDREVREQKLRDLANQNEVGGEGEGVRRGRRRRHRLRRTDHRPGVGVLEADEDGADADDEGENEVSNVTARGRRRRTRAAITTTKAKTTSDDSEGEAEQVLERLTTVRLIDDDDDGDMDEDEGECVFCDSIEGKLQSLEQQLDVLREVVKLCSHNEEELKRERKADNSEKLKRSKTWMGRIANPFAGTGVQQSTTASHRSKMKEEVDVLRKATDFLFQKLDSTSPSK